MMLTPEEKAVVQAAIHWQRNLRHDWVRIVGSPEDILCHDTMRLIYNCAECNTDTHRCGGCGENVQHGDNDCGKNCTNDPVVERDGSTLRDASSFPCWECCDDPNEDPITWCDDRPEDFGKTDPNHPCRLRAHHPTLCLNRPEMDCACDRSAKMYCASPRCHGGSDLLLQWYPRTWVDVRAGDQVRLPDSDVTATIASAVHLHWHVDPRSNPRRPEALEWSGVQVRFLEEDLSPMRTMDPAKPIDILLSLQEYTHIKFIGWANRIGMITKEVPR